MTPERELHALPPYDFRDSLDLEIFTPDERAFADMLAESNFDPLSRADVLRRYLYDHRLKDGVNTTMLAIKFQEDAEAFELGATRLSPDELNEYAKLRAEFERRKAETQAAGAAELEPTSPSSTGQQKTIGTFRFPWETDDIALSITDSELEPDESIELKHRKKVIGKKEILVRPIVDQKLMDYPNDPLNIDEIVAELQGKVSRSTVVRVVKEDYKDHYVPQPRAKNPKPFLLNVRVESDESNGSKEPEEHIIFEATEIPTDTTQNGSKITQTEESDYSRLRFDKLSPDILELIESYAQEDHHLSSELVGMARYDED